MSFDCCALWLGWVCFDLLLNSFILPVMNTSLCSSSYIFLRRGATADLARWTLNTSPSTASRAVASTARPVTCWKTATAEWCTCQVWRPHVTFTDRPRLYCFSIYTTIHSIQYIVQILHGHFISVSILTILHFWMCRTVFFSFIKTVLMLAYSHIQIFVMLFLSFYLIKNLHTFAYSHLQYFILNCT